jgi:hypothetical protein
MKMIARSMRALVDECRNNGPVASGSCHHNRVWVLDGVGPFAGVLRFGVPVESVARHALQAEACVYGRHTCSGREGVAAVVLMTWGRLGWLHSGARSARRYGGWGWARRRGGGVRSLDASGSMCASGAGGMRGGAAAARGSGILLAASCRRGQERL